MDARPTEWTPRLDPMASPDARESYVEQLRTEVSDGRYQIAADDVAAALLAEVFSRFA